MKTAKKKEETKETTPLVPCITLWKNVSKSGLEYLSGFTTDKEGNKCEDSIDVVAYYNTNKKNPNEPDIRVYESTEKGTGNEVVSLWDKIAKSGTKYLSGKTNENEQVVAYYGDEFETKRPFVRVYYK